MPTVFVGKSVLHEVATLVLTVITRHAVAGRQELLSITCPSKSPSSVNGLIEVEREASGGSNYRSSFA